MDYKSHEQFYCETSSRLRDPRIETSYTEQRLLQLVWLGWSKTVRRTEGLALEQHKLKQGRRCNSLRRRRWTLRHKLQGWYTTQQLKVLLQSCKKRCTKWNWFLLPAKIAATNCEECLWWGMLHWAIFRATWVATKLWDKLQEKFPSVTFMRCLSFLFVNESLCTKANNLTFFNY